MAVRRNIAANYAGQAWTALMGLAFVPLYIRYLGMEAYGLIGVFAMLQTWLSLLDFGLTPTLTRELARPVADARDLVDRWSVLRSIEIAVLAIAAGLAVLLWWASGWVATTWLQARQLSAGTVAGACAVMGLLVALRFVENIYRAGLVGLQRQVGLNVATSALATLRGAGAVAVLELIAADIEAFFVWQAAVSVLSIAVFAAMLYRSLARPAAPPAFGWHRLRGIARFSAGTFGISALGFAISQTDKLVLSRMLDLAEFGRYALAAALAAYVRLFAASIDQAVYPKLVELSAAGRTVELARTYHRASQLTVVLMGGLGAGLAVLSSAFLFAWTGDSDLADRVAPLLTLLVAGMVANGLLNMPYSLQMAAGWTSLLLRTNVVMACVFVPAVILMTARFGAMGAALTWVAVNLVYLVTVVNLMHVRLLREERRRWYLEDVGGPLLGALAAVAAVRFCAPWPTTRAAAGVSVAVGCLAAVLGAAAAAPIVRHRLLTTTRRARHA
jgi:O-antigen/teichoic acid export membrane protein